MPTALCASLIGRIVIMIIFKVTWERNFSEKGGVLQDFEETKVIFVWHKWLTNFLFKEESLFTPRLFRVSKSELFVSFFFIQMWMNALRTHVRTVQNAPIHTETINARAAVLSRERTVMWVRKSLICDLYSNFYLIITHRIHRFFTLKHVVPFTILVTSP